MQVFRDVFLLLSLAALLLAFCRESRPRTCSETVCFPARLLKWGDREKINNSGFEIPHAVRAKLFFFFFFSFLPIRNFQGKE